ncbi:GntR family transcriptional regulator [Pseudonocardia sp. CA-107938]|uniref:GntR family transcriptional regulator n=1 Tax=Pseudonocardia sp. CA-107938 TaxID=3240021 RepID=UPI003D8CA7D3
MVEPRVRKAERRGLADEVADRVRDAIFAGAYGPGEQLRETELAAELDVSRGPVREALLRLQAEGLVHLGWHRGATVTALTSRDVAELHSLRGALETLAVRLVVEAADPAGIDAVDEAVARMAAAADVHEMAACDIAFHDAVYAATGHGRLVEAWRAIRNQVHLFLLARVDASAEGYLAELPAEHRELAAALRAGDTDAALALFDEHRRRAFDVLADHRP